METYGGVDVQIHVFLTPALVGDEWSASRLCPLNSGERAPYPLHRRLGEPIASLGDKEKRKFLTLLGIELRPLGS
jgi:hypothetical protein